MGVAYARQGEFYDRGARDRPPLGGWLGRWPLTAERRGMTLQRGTTSDASSPEGAVHNGGCPTAVAVGGVLSTYTRRNSARWRFRTRFDLARWYDNGWFQVENESNGTTRRQINTRIGTETARVVAIRREAVTEVEGG